MDRKSLRLLAIPLVAFTAVVAVFYFAAVEPATYSYPGLQGLPIDREANQISYFVRESWWIFPIFIWGTWLGLFALAERRKRI